MDGAWVIPSQFRVTCYDKTCICFEKGLNFPTFSSCPNYLVVPNCQVPAVAQSKSGMRNQTMLTVLEPIELISRSVQEATSEGQAG